MRNTHIRLIVAGIVVWVSAFSASLAEEKAPGSRLNVLMIAVDDLRPELGCYGASYVRSPRIDKLAAEGVTFMRAYCQQAVCSPSRTSLLTGLRPDTTRVYDLNLHFRKTIPDAVTLPEYFKKHGYHTQGLSKVFHGDLDDPQSWSVPHWAPKAPAYHNDASLAIIAERRRRAEQEGRPLGVKVLERDPATGAPLRVQRLGRISGPSWEAAEVPDSETADGMTADRAVEVLGQIKDKPFFLAVGFHKPHLPFVAPKKYFEIYSLDAIRAAPNPRPPANVPAPALPDFAELRGYSDMPRQGPVPQEQARELIRAYRAATTFVDAQIGRVVDELDRLGLRERTVVVLWGDHGWHLGEHGHWCKHTNFEVAARSLMIISAPGMGTSGRKTAALAEFVDIYPTLCQLAGLPIPRELEGLSLVPVLKNPDRPWKSAALSQYPRGKLMGHSMRTDRYRYTEWAEPGGTPVAVELYDHESDPQEDRNVAGDEKHRELTDRLAGQLRAGWRQALPAGGSNQDP